MSRVLITGVAGYIGSKLAANLAKKSEFAEIVGTDIKPPPKDIARLVFYEHDVRSQMVELLNRHAIDTVVHAAYVLPPLHDKQLMEDINLNGTHTVLSSCVEANISHIMYLSSATAYGFHPDNDRPLTEDSPLRGNEDFTYAKNKRIIEGMLVDFAKEHQEITITILRPAFVVGPGFNNPLARYLQKSIVMLPFDGEPFQFVHEDDLIEIMVQLLLKKKQGTFNVGGDGTVPPRDMVRIMGNTPLPLPFGLLYPLNGVAWLLRLSFLTEFPSPALNMIRYPWVVSNDKLKREIGYSYQYTSKEAFEDFARYVREFK
jgi:UDP-glucose 4-epimerase